MTDLFMDLDRSSPVPLYYQVSQQIEHAISSGQLGPGARLDNEISLADQFGLSRPTMRRAIQELVDKGLLVRKRGVGTQVVHGAVSRPGALTSLFDDLKRSGQPPRPKVLTTEALAAGDEVAEPPNVPATSSAFPVRRPRFANGEPL